MTCTLRAEHEQEGPGKDSSKGRPEALVGGVWCLWITEGRPVWWKYVEWEGRDSQWACKKELGQGHPKLCCLCGQVWVLFYVEREPVMRFGKGAVEMTWPNLHLLKIPLWLLMEYGLKYCGEWVQANSLSTAIAE